MPNPIPSAVLAQAAKADAQLSEMRASAERGESAAPTATADSGQPEAQPRMMGVPVAPSGEIAQGANNVSPTGGVVHFNGATPAGDERATDPKYWENRFRTTEGLNKKLAEQNKQLRGIANDLNTRLQALESKAEEARREELTRNDALTRLEQERGDMEDEYLPVLKQLQQTIVAQSSEIDTLKSVIDELRGHLGGVRREVEDTERGNAANSAEGYKQALFRAFGNEQNFVVVNNEMDGHPWLDVVPAGMTQSRKEALAEAHNAMDAPRVLAIFDAFMKDTGMVSGGNGAGQPTVTPSTSVAGARTSSSEQIPLSRYRAFSESYAKGAYRNKPEEGEKLKAYFDQALREGRIVEGA